MGQGSSRERVIDQGEVTEGSRGTRSASCDSLPTADERLAENEGVGVRQAEHRKRMISKVEQRRDLMREYLLKITCSICSPARLDTSDRSSFRILKIKEIQENSSSCPFCDLLKQFVESFEERQQLEEGILSLGLGLLSGMGLVAEITDREEVNAFQLYVPRKKGKKIVILNSAWKGLC